MKQEFTLNELYKLERGMWSAYYEYPDGWDSQWAKNVHDRLSMYILQAKNEETERSPTAKLSS